jgi:hypothetical protein
VRAIQGTGDIVIRIAFWRNRTCSGQDGGGEISEWGMLVTINDLNGPSCVLVAQPGRPTGTPKNGLQKSTLSNSEFGRKGFAALVPSESDVHTCLAEVSVVTCSDL